MKYITSLQAAEMLGVTKRRINSMCADGEIPGAHKDGYRWLIPEDRITIKMGTGKNTNRTFNTTGICEPEKHYMVSLEQRLVQVKKLVDDGNYFTINRARQFGKTTTLHALSEYLSHNYFVVSMDFQMQMSSAKFRSENSFSLAFARAFVNSFRTNPDSIRPEYENAVNEFAANYAADTEKYELVELFQALSTLCGRISGEIVLMIDEVDSAANNQVFLPNLPDLLYIG